MEEPFWIPTLLALGSLWWNYHQDRKLLRLQTDAEKQRLIHRHQFEKEFSIYTDLWGKLIELRNAAVLLRPMLDQRDKSKSKEEIKNERIINLHGKFDLVIDAFDKNKPFYSGKVCLGISDLLKPKSLNQIPLK